MDVEIAVNILVAQQWNDQWCVWTNRWTLYFSSKQLIYLFQRFDNISQAISLKLFYQNRYFLWMNKLFNFLRYISCTFARTYIKYLKVVGKHCFFDYLNEIINLFILKVLIYLCYIVMKHTDENTFLFYRKICCYLFLIISKNYQIKIETSQHHFVLHFNILIKRKCVDNWKNLFT